MQMLLKIVHFILLIPLSLAMPADEKARLRLQVLEMFKHGFGSYMVRSAVSISLLYSLCS